MSSDDTFPLPDTNSTPSNESSYNVNSRIMIVAIVVLFGVVFFILGLHTYAKWFWRNGGGFLNGTGPVMRWTRRRRLRRLRFTVSGRSKAGQVGLDDLVKESLPTFAFNPEKATADGMECAVCLEEFGEGELARLLPKCSHSFHIDCIDIWFQSNSTCPLCRCSVVPDPPLAAETTSSDLTSLPREPPHCVPVISTRQNDDGNYYLSEDLPPHMVENFYNDVEAVEAVVGSLLRIPDQSANNITAEELSSNKRRSSADFAPKAAPTTQYPSNVLIWGNTTQVVVGHGMGREENVIRQASSGGISGPNCSALDDPSVSTTSQVAAFDLRCSLSDPGASNPIGRLVTSSFRRLMSIRRGTLTPRLEQNSSCGGDDCEQGEEAQRRSRC